MNYKYEALSRAGVIKSGLTEAPSLTIARQKIEDHGLEVLNISPSFQFRIRGRHLANKILKDFFSDMGSLLEAGMTVGDSLDVIRTTAAAPPLVRVASRMKNNLEKGYSFSKSMEDTGLFPEMAVSAVTVGERAGALSETLINLGRYYEEKDAFLTEITRKLVYPAILFAGVLGFLALAGFWVLPRLAPFLANLDLPLPTRVVLWASGAMREHWYAMAVGAPLLAAGLYFGAHLFRESELARTFYEKTRLGRVLKEVIFSNLFLNLSTLHHNGVPLGEAVSLVADSVSHYIAGCLGKTRELMEKGLPFSESLGEQDVFPSFIIQTVKKGESSGQLDRYLQQIASFYLRRTQKNMDAIAQVVQPVLLAGLGGMVLFVAMSILVPIYGNLNTLGSQVR